MDNSGFEDKSIEDKIRIAIEALRKNTSTTEYRAREIFHKLGYSAIQQYYLDWDGEKTISREIDIVARDWGIYSKSGQEFNLLLNIIADVKFREFDPEAILIAFDNEPSINSKETSISQGSRRKHLTKWIYDPHKDLPFIPFEEKTCFNIFQDFIIKEINNKNLKDKDGKKRSGKEIIQNGCKQILSALNSTLDGVISDLEPIFNVPILILGNNVKFITGSLGKILEQKYENADFVIYSTQVPTNLVTSGYIGGLTFPVVITSLDNLQGTLTTIIPEVLSAIN